MDKLFLQVKAGDLVPDENAKHDSSHDGMMIDYIYEPEWGKPFVPSSDNKKIFSLIEVDPKYLSLVEEKLAPVNPPEDPRDDVKPIANYRRKTGYFDLDALGLLFGSSDLATKWRGKDIIEPLDGKFLELDKIIKPTSSIDFDTKIYYPDINLISSGTHTVGSGGTYATLAGYAADVTNLTGNITAQLISDVTETAAFEVNVAHGGYTHEITADTAHNGFYNQGWIVNYNHNTASSMFTLRSTDWDIHGFHIKCIKSTGGKHVFTFTSTATGNVHDMFLDGNQLHTTGFATFYTYGNGAVDGYNLVIWDWFNACFFGMDWNHVTCYSQADRNYDGINYAGMVHDNNSYLEAAGIYGDVYRVTNSTGRNGMSTDDTCDDFTTQSNNNINITMADEFVSQTDTDYTDFLFPKAGGVGATGGNTTQKSSTDIRGVEWDATSPSIGAFQITGGPPLGGLSLLGVGR